MNYVLVFLLLMNTYGYGATPLPKSILFQPYIKNRNSGTFLVSGLFEDVKVLDPARRNLAYWMVRKGPLKVEHFFKQGKPSEIRITENADLYSKQLTYAFNQGRWHLIKAVKRPQLLMTAELLNVSENTNICSLHQKLYADFKIASKAFNIDACEKNLEDKIIDPTCKSVMTPQEYGLLKDAYVADLMMPESENQLLACLKSFKTQNILANAYGIKDQESLKTQMEVIELKYKLNAEKFHSLPELMEKKVKCAFSPTGQPAAITDGNGVTTYFKAKNASEQKFSSAYFEKLAGHELIHNADVVNENTTKNLVSICFDNASKVTADGTAKNQIAAKVVKNNNAEIIKQGSPLLPTEQDTQDAFNRVAANTNPKITEQDIAAAVPQTMTLAQTGTPPPAQLTQSVIESSQASDGSASGVRPEYVGPVVAQGEVALNKGRTLLNLTSAGVNTLAQAGPTSSSRAPASTYTAKEPEAVRSLRNIASTSGSGTTASAKGLENTAAELPTLNTNQGSEARSAKAAKAAGRNEIGDDSGSNSSGTRGSGSSLRQAAISSGGSGTSGSQQSNSAPRTKASGRGNSDVQKLLVNFEKPELYRVTKSKINSDKFKKTLEENNITVLGLGGEAHGASNGSIVYLDEGTRFVRQK